MFKYLYVICVNQSFNEFAHKHKSLTHSATMQSHTDSDRMIWHVLAQWLKCIALTCPSPIRACADCSGLLKTGDGGTGGAGAPFAGSDTVVEPWQGGRKLQPRGGSSSALLSTPPWPDGVNQSSPKMSASAQAISDWNKWQMGMLFPLFNQFHQMWFYLL